MNGERGMTSPNPDWALIIHADSADTRVDVYWVDIRAGRLGLALAREVKAWRKRDDLLTIGQRFTVVPPPTGGPVEPVLITEPDSPEVFIPSAPPDVPGLAPVAPVDGRRLASRHQWLRGRVAAVLGHSDTVGKALQRTWPTGIPGLKHDGHSMDDLDAIQTAVERVEKDHSVPFYPPWDDPDIDEAITHHPSWSDRWAKPERVTDHHSADAVAGRLSIQQAIMEHPRRLLLTSWVSAAISGGINHNIDTTALAHALFEFATMDEATWPDEALTEMLNASLITLGYRNGLTDLGNFDPPDAPKLMSAAFAISAGNAVLVYGEDGTPTLLTDWVEKPL